MPRSRIVDEQLTEKGIQFTYISTADGCLCFEFQKRRYSTYIVQGMQSLQCTVQYCERQKCKQTKPGQTNPGQTNPGQTNPGQTNPGQTNPGHDKPWTQ
jgi:hypothetical protein